MAYILAVNPRILADSGGPCIPNEADGGEFLNCILRFVFICTRQDEVYCHIFSNSTDMYNTSFQVYLEKRTSSVLSKSNGSMSRQLRWLACLVRLCFMLLQILSDLAVLRF